eukprot:COSAG05_NODE_10925_length_539_cov_0.609091_1_plen_82_part_01
MSRVGENYEDVSCSLLSACRWAEGFQHTNCAERVESVCSSAVWKKGTLPKIDVYFSGQCPMCENEKHKKTPKESRAKLVPQK